MKTNMFNAKKFREDSVIISNMVNRNSLDTDFHQYNFYCDETNNYIKVRIKDDGFNDNRILKSHYVLGGICFEKSIDCDKLAIELFEKLPRYQNKELKAKRLFERTKNIFECFDKDVVTQILDFTFDYGFIHYSSLNALYFTIIEIIDSMLTLPEEKLFPIDYINLLKNDLYLVMRYNIYKFIAISNKYNYPNIAMEDIKPFLEDIYEILDGYKGEIYSKDGLLRIIENHYDDKELIFLTNNEEKTIVEEFSGLRLQKCMLYYDSYIVFDKEIRDEKYLADFEFTVDGNNRHINYKFVESDGERLVQVSDILISLVSKILTYIVYEFNENSMTDINNQKLHVRKNIKKMLMIMKKSYEHDSYLISSVSAMQENQDRDIVIDYLIKNIVI